MGGSRSARLTRATAGCGAPGWLRPPVPTATRGCPRPRRAAGGGGPRHAPPDSHRNINHDSSRPTSHQNLPFYFFTPHSTATPTFLTTSPWPLAPPGPALPPGNALRSAQVSPSAAQLSAWSAGSSPACCGASARPRLADALAPHSGCLDMSFVYTSGAVDGGRLAGSTPFMGAQHSGQPASNAMGASNAYACSLNISCAGSVDQLSAVAAASAHAGWRCRGAAAQHKPSHNTAVPVYVMLPLDTVGAGWDSARAGNRGRACGASRPPIAKAGAPPRLAVRPPAHARRARRAHLKPPYPLATNAGPRQINADGVFRYASAPWFAAALQLLANSGVHGVAVDVWVRAAREGGGATGSGPAGAPLQQAPGSRRQLGACAALGKAGRGSPRHSGSGGSCGCTAAGAEQQVKEQERDQGQQQQQRQQRRQQQRLQRWHPRQRQHGQ
jgi:hypothetical protein